MLISIFCVFSFSPLTCPAPAFFFLFLFLICILPEKDRGVDGVYQPVQGMYGKRDKLTLKVSFDDGMTWPKEHWILFDQYRSAGYSCITSIDENSIGILYESSQSDLAFIKIDLTEILK